MSLTSQALAWLYRLIIYTHTQKGQKHSTVSMKVHWKNLKNNNLNSCDRGITVTANCERTHYLQPHFSTWDDITYPIIHIWCLLINFPANKRRNMSNLFHLDHWEKENITISLNWPMSLYKKYGIGSIKHSPFSQWSLFLTNTNASCKKKKKRVASPLTSPHPPPLFFLYTKFNTQEFRRNIWHSDLTCLLSDRQDKELLPFHKGY